MGTTATSNSANGPMMSGLASFLHACSKFCIYHTTTILNPKMRAQDTIHPMSSNIISESTHPQILIPEAWGNQAGFSGPSFAHNGRQTPNNMGNFSPRSLLKWLIVQKSQILWINRIIGIRLSRWQYIT